MSDEQDVPLFARGGAPQGAVETAVRRVRGAAAVVRDRAREVGFRRWWAQHPGVRVQRPVLVIGAPRSGTSVLVNLLARHPALDVWTEAGRTWDPVSYDDAEADHDWDAGRATDAEVDRLHARFAHHLARSGRERFANKHPRTSVRLPFVAAVFPDAHVVNVRRDGRAVASSVVERVAREPWRRQVPFAGFCKPPGWRDLLRDDPLEQAALQWQGIVRTVERDRHLFADRWVDVDYADLCADPRGELATVHRAVGLDVVTDDLPAQLPRRDDGWRRRLDDQQRRRLASLLEEDLRREGHAVG